MQRPDRRRHRIVTALALVWLAGGGAAAGQNTYPANVTRDLPSGGNLYSLLETAQPEITTDRFNSGGLNGGQPDLVSAFLASWSQTQYRIGDVSISSLVDGTPMLFPELNWWSGIDIATGLMPEGTAPGLGASLQPRTSSERWTRTFEAVGSGGVLAANPASSRPPAINSLDTFGHASALISGRHQRLGLVAGGAWTQSKISERGATNRTVETASAFVNAAWTLSAERTLRGLGWIQSNGALHVQSTLERNDRWRVYGGYTSRTTEGLHSGTTRLELDRLADGPIPLAIESGGDERRWVAGAHIAPHSSGRHTPTFRTEVEGATLAISPSFSGIVAERVDGIPARLWDYKAAVGTSARHAWIFGAAAADRIAITSSATLDAFLRFESVHGEASHALVGISWQTLLPSATFHWDLGTPLHLRLTTGVSRSADQLLMSWLAFGDPAAGSADVYRWDGSPLTGAPVVARVGPGTGGDSSFSAIDPDLKRPITDQFVLGVSSTPTHALHLNVTGLARRQRDLIQPVNTGVPISSYSLFTIADANADLVGPGDDQQLPVYDRKPESFGQDRYLLTNPDVAQATMGAVIVSARVTTDRVLFEAGGTASASVGPGANRGFTAIENDQSIPGELFTNPNASTYARGRLFNDRAYTIKTLAVVKMPADMRLGAIARFQDGQPFSRLAIVTGLNQGAEAIQAFANGRSRFSFRTTLDLRLQKFLVLDAIRLELIADAYNVLNLSTEVEEYVVTGPRFRETTAVQPPRSFHLGARVMF